MVIDVFQLVLGKLVICVEFFLRKFAEGGFCDETCV